MSFAEASVNDAGEDGQYRFYKDVDVPEGRWQYKFRIGHGDWWVLDEQAETDTDDAGNVNNVFVAQAVDDAKDGDDTPAERLDPGFMDQESIDEESDSEENNDANDQLLYSVVTPIGTVPVEDYFDGAHATAPMLAHESGAAYEQEGEDDADADADESNLGDEGSEAYDYHPRFASSRAMPPLLSPITENVPSKSAEVQVELEEVLAASDSDASTPHAGAEDADGSMSDASDASDGVVPDFVGAILHGDEDEELRLEHAPLFTYECMGAGEVEIGLPSSSSSTASSPMDESGEPDVDMEDPSLEKFPSDGPHILEFIRAAETRLSEDLTSDEDSKVSTSPNMPGTPVETASSHRSSPTEEHSPHLDKIPEEYLPEPDLDVHSPTLIAFNVHHNEGVLLGQDGLFDFPRQFDACRHVNDDMRSGAVTMAATKIEPPQIVVEGPQDAIAEDDAKKATAETVPSDLSDSTESSEEQRPNGIETMEGELSERKSEDKGIRQRNPPTGPTIAQAPKNHVDVPIRVKQPRISWLGSLDELASKVLPGPVYRFLENRGQQRIASGTIFTSVLALCMYYYCS